MRGITITLVFRVVITILICSISANHARMTSPITCEEYSQDEVRQTAFSLTSSSSGIDLFWSA